MSDSRIRVIYVAGASRSGSTLLGRLLGAIPGHLDLGELRHLFCRGLARGQLCSCGAPLPDCAFWSEVIADAFGEPTPARIGEWGRELRRAIRQRRVARQLLVPARSGGAASILGRLLGSAQRVSGCEVLVDSSKSPGAVPLLARIPSIRLSVVEIVRDARAVAWSWQRRVRRPEITGAEVEMDRLPPWRAALEWNLAYGLLAAVRRRVSVPWSVVRYEDLAKAPAGVLRSVLPERELDLGFLREGGADLPPGHSVSGNPSRFRSGIIPIRPDEDWIDKLPARDRRLVTALCRPGLAHFGYLTGRGAR